jgi:hypothetical protein
MQDSDPEPEENLHLDHKAVLINILNAARRNDLLLLLIIYSYNCPNLVICLYTFELQLMLSTSLVYLI